MKEDPYAKAFISKAGQLVIQGRPKGIRDSAYISLEDWAEIRKQADAAVLAYVESLVREYLP